MYLYLNPRFTSPQLLSKPVGRIERKTLGRGELWITSSPLDLMDILKFGFIESPIETWDELRVEIPLEFRDNLRARFSPDLETDFRVYLEEPAIPGDPDFEPKMIRRVPCQLCEAFKVCKECPFGRFKAPRISGCWVWITAVLGRRPSFSGNAHYLWWYPADESEVVLQLEDLVESAKSLITWVERRE